MGNVILFPAFIFMCCFFSHNVRGNPIGTSTINCKSGSYDILPTVAEGYNGAVEKLTGIDPGESVVLMGFPFPEDLQFLELNFTLGDTFAVVQTKSPLDPDILTDTNGELGYSVQCVSTEVQNIRILKINDINDNPPVFKQNEYRKTISEALPVGSLVEKVEAVDADVSTVNNRVTYSILDLVQDKFMIESDGNIFLMSTLNYNLANSYNFTVEARDVGGLTDTTEVFFKVEDFDNTSPYFQHSLYHATIQENQIGMFRDILPEAILAKDGDTGINDPVSYSINQVSPDKYQSYFSIDETTGVITVVLSLDREEISSIILNIQAAQVSDNLKTANAAVSLNIEDVNDNQPEFDKSSYFSSILENSPNGFILFRPIISDKDEGGFNGTLEVLPETVPFSFSSDGTLMVKDYTLLDRETVPSFTFQIKARENQAPFRFALADVNVTLLDENDNSPQSNSSMYEGKVFNNQTVGIWVTKVTAEDPDEGPNGRVKYAIVGGNQDGYFNIDEDTGDISLSKEIPFRENEVLRFSLFVTARDEGTPARASSLLVNILAPGDTKPQFLSPTYGGRVQEEMEPPVEILKVTFLSVSPINEVDLQVMTHGDKFSIDSEGHFSTLKKLDYESEKNYTVSVSISDGTSHDQATVLVEVTDINDNSPVFTPNSTNVPVPEDTEIGTSVMKMAARDSDEGFNGKLFYSLQGGEGKFRIDSQSGEVFLASELDRETLAEIRMEVVARDQGQPPQSATGSILLTVTDVNDNPPQFPLTEFQVAVPENAAVGTIVLGLAAVDPDEGPNAVISYHIAQQSPSSDLPVFILDPNSGDLQLDQPLDFETVKEYVLLVEASDSGRPRLNGTCSVMVRVQDVNDNAPEFGKEKYDVAVYENLPSGAPCVTLDVTDKDEAGFSNGHFVLISDVFGINKQGTVLLNSNATLDREEWAHYVLQVVAVDSHVDGLSATAQLIITVLDVNDNDPQFSPHPELVQVPEGEYSPESPKELCHIGTTDADEGDNGRVTLSIFSSDANRLFEIREDGTLLAVSPLDREMKDVYELVIVASDEGIPVRKNVTGITVSILDENDNDPEFSQEIYVIRILVKDAKEGDTVLTLSATDKDIGNNSLISYSFSSESPFLLLDSKTGVITLTSNVRDVTEDTTFNLTALAQDKGEPSRSSTATVQVFLWWNNSTSDIIFESYKYNFSVVENEPSATVVGTVKALSQSDTVQVTYSLKLYEELFSVDHDGMIRTRQMLDRESQEWYTLAVEATDSRARSTSALAMVTVQVQDVNEAPVFNRTSYSASIFNSSPYKHPVVQVKATDPDVGENGQLEYSLQEASPLFDVEPSTGQVYVVSLQGQTGQVALHVKATDSQGLFATAKVEVIVERSSTSDIVVISIAEAANTVEKKAPQLEKSLEQVLDMSITVISIWAAGSIRQRSSRSDVATNIGFIATDSRQNIVPSEQVRSELENRREKMEEQLKIVFGQEMTFTIENPSEVPGPDQATVITLGVLLGLSVAVLLAISPALFVMVRKVKRTKDGGDTHCIISRNSMDVPAHLKKSPSSARKDGDGDTDSNDHTYEL
ncbi:protocadherin Fat 4 [Brienomyrus brachyistius]|uniref:protocadherin Fat 4 n=1 Tax=Brienomyrus brachyistius TaxID=42636 RepID=UPI0020B26AA9|nr:protocadherin Fat 4 [Brienomyrus brachyistius]